MTVAGIILAAGNGTRMRTKKPKPLHAVAGLSLLAHTVQIMRVGGIEAIGVVVSQELAGNSALEELLQMILKFWFNPNSAALLMP